MVILSVLLVRIQSKIKILSEITGQDIHVRIDVKDLRGEQQFWEKLKENLDVIDHFYSLQLSQFIKQFNSLVVQTVRLVRVAESFYSSNIFLGTNG
jgi:hypothetical protein